MKYLRLIYLLSLFSSIISCKQAEQKPKDNVAQSQLKSGTNEIEQTVVAFHRAMQNTDSLQLAELTSEDLTYGHSSGLVQNKREFIDDILYGPFDFSLIENPDQSIQIIDCTAIVRHVFKARAINNGENVDIRIGNIQVYQKNKAGVWQLLARQAYKL